MTDVVLDASAVLAYMQGEPGGEIVAKHLTAASIGAVNFSEIIGKLVDKGLDAASVDAALAGIGLDVVDFDQEQARDAGLLRADTRKHGLSLGDRACLALGRSRGVPVLTADRVWAAASVGVEIRLIR